MIPIALAILLLCAVFGCSAKSASARPEAAYDNEAYDSSYYYEPAYAPEEPVEATTEAAYGMLNGDAPQPNPSQALSKRKIIRNADMSVETLSFDEFIDRFVASVNSFGGYVESSSIGNRGYRNGQQLRNARYTVRVPAEQLDAFLNAVSGLGNVTSLNTGLKDVTTNYVDSEKHLESLRVEQEALLEILAKATTVEDIITVQDRLAYVRYEIESYESILRTYDDQIALSSVNLTVNEVEKETPVEKETFGQEVSRRFNESLTDVGDSCKNFAAGFLGNSPFIVITVLILGLIALVVVLIIRGIRKRSAKRANAQNNVPKA